MYLLLFIVWMNRYFECFNFFVYIVLDIVILITYASISLYLLFLFHFSLSALFLSRPIYLINALKLKIQMKRNTKIVWNRFFFSINISVLLWKCISEWRIFSVICSFPFCCLCQCFSSHFCFAFSSTLCDHIKSNTIHLKIWSFSWYVVRYYYNHQIRIFDPITATELKIKKKTNIMHMVYVFAMNSSSSIGIHKTLIRINVLDIAITRLTSSFDNNYLFVCFFFFVCLNNNSLICFYSFIHSLFFSFLSEQRLHKYVTIWDSRMWECLYVQLMCVILMSKDKQ